MFGTPHVHQKRRGASVALQDFTLLAKLEDFDVETHKIVQKFQKAELSPEYAKLSAERLLEIV